MQIIDLKQVFTQSVCSFEAAKLAKASGMTSKNTFFSYDNQGEVNDAGWLEDAGYKDFYPCINIALAISMLQDTTLDLLKAECYQMAGLTGDAGSYCFKYDGELIDKDEHLVDLLIRIWIKYKE